ncbi:MAG: hypothetical protein Q4Q58_03205 [Thermoplasmata archaeon]|nr:hypothetical protein [Thermoplasmata archaeon]
MSSTYFDVMRTYGFSNSSTASVRRSFTCPRCGFEFSLVYARTFACRGCPDAARGCQKVRCARCDAEFPIRSSADVFGKVQERTLSDHMGWILADRNAGLGLVSDKRRRQTTETAYAGRRDPPDSRFTTG